MDTPEIKPEIKVLSRSAFHDYMTSPSATHEGHKSSFNPYRKKAGIFNFLSMDAIEKVLSESTKEIKNQSNHGISHPPVMSGLEPLR